jgi:hypothetical protein
VHLSSPPLPGPAPFGDRKLGSPWPDSVCGSRCCYKHVALVFRAHAINGTFFPPPLALAISQRPMEFPHDFNLGMLPGPRARRRKLRMSGVVDPSSQGGGPMGVEIVSRSLRRGADGLSFSRSAFSGYFPHRAGASMEIQRCGVKPCDAASCPARRCRQFNRKSVFTRRTGTIGRLCRMQTSSNLLWLSRH